MDARTPRTRVVRRAFALFPMLAKCNMQIETKGDFVPWQSSQWVKSIREVTRIFNEHGIQVSHSKVYQIQVQRDDLEAGRPNTRVIRPLPKQAQFHAVGKRGERYL